MKNIRQQGSALIVVTIILLVAILATSGYFFLQSLNKKVTQPGTSQATPNKNETPGVSSTDPEKGYVVLKDWGVKFKTTDALTSTVVKYSISNDTYAFTTARIEQLGGECAKAPYNVTVSMTRDTVRPPSGPATLLNEQPINGYYYSTYGPSANCSAFNANGQMQTPNQIEVDDRAALKESLATISQ